MTSIVLCYSVSISETLTADSRPRILASLRGRRADAAALLVVVAFALAICAPVLRGKVPTASNTLSLWSPWSQLPHERVANTSLSDSALLYLSWEVFARQSIADGEWPLWDPNSFAGFPFAAEIGRASCRGRVSHVGS